MEKLLFLTTWDFSDGPSAGITKKIKSQMKAFARAGFSVDYTYISDGCAWICTDGTPKRLGPVGSARKIMANYYFAKELKAAAYPAVYSRYGLMDSFYDRVLRTLHQNGSKIVVEIPTYPYDKEKNKGIAWWILFTWDKLLRHRLKRNVNRIFTYSRDEEIFGIPTICSSNGLDFDTVRMRKEKKPDGVIDLVAVAGLAKWHGYDRLLKGMGEYYRKKNDRIVNFHIVGDGPPMEEYKRIIAEYDLQEHVFFYGILTGEALDDVYDRCDLGVENLGFHRTGVFYASTLKSREYAAKGLPFLTSLKLDVFEGEDFILKFAADESDIDVERIVGFYDKIYEGKDEEAVGLRIRQKAQQVCDINVTMRPVIQYLKEGSKDAD